jgi:SagB-type dehydrogenase family enzyme
MRLYWLLWTSLVLLSLTGCQTDNFPAVSPSISIPTINLPAPRLTGPLSLEEVLNSRRSVREFTSESLTLFEVSQLLWSAQGITAQGGFKTAPSAGGLYPLRIYLISGEVIDLAPGLYRYNPEEHNLVLLSRGALHQALSSAALGQKPVADAAVDLVISAEYERTTKKYGERGVRYSELEAGHAAQNILLQAVALGLGSVPIGAFDDNRIKTLLALPEAETPLYVIPVGHTDF